MMLAAETATTMVIAAAVAKMTAANNDGSCCCGGGRGRGGEDDVGNGGSGLTGPFVLERTGCCMLSSSLGVGQTPTLEVPLHISSLIVLSSESAVLATALANKSVRSATASTNRK